ncbi:chemotaxis protein CheW [Massilia litorea]|jgi:purine-binding chemotaxis protein CheW|uniref:Chemotaxis protein CheW n=1 Tax=Massilia litorea TaxID=2769491 RepID=A0A7L9TZ46_9BURK|nr:chemotaxis protein CheW [Massilia litorea]QOL48053.1 chemotaxis protein CheW [Massilia litorea]
MHKDTMAFHPAANQFLSFRLGGLEYGVDFGKVQELRIIRSLERFAADGAIVEGVAVSRGVIMPIVDMRAAFCGHPVVTTPTTDVIILKLSTCVMGMVVDGVTDVVTLYPDQISPIPGTDGGAIDYLIGLGVTEGRRLILVDIDRLMSIDKKSSDRHVA